MPTLLCQQKIRKISKRFTKFCQIRLYFFQNQFKNSV